jgi:hypothetical protein
MTQYLDPQDFSHLLDPTLYLDNVPALTAVAHTSQAIADGLHELAESIAPHHRAEMPAVAMAWHRRSIDALRLATIAATNDSDAFRRAEAVLRSEGLID